MVIDDQMDNAGGDKRIINLFTRAQVAQAHYERRAYINLRSILHILWPRQNIRICMKNAANTL